MRRQADRSMLAVLKQHKRALLRIVLLGALALFLYDGANRVEITYYDYTGRDLPQSFDGYRIVQLSDLHNAVFPNENEDLIEKVRALEPDLIVLTGDFIDASTHTDYDDALLFMQQIPKIAPCYYVFGNHEYRLKKSLRDAFVGQIEKWGVHYLDNSAVQIASDAGETLTLIGLNDLSLRSKDLEQLVNASEDDFQIVLAHEPAYFSSYAETGADLVFSGHEHGGQFRIPFTHIGVMSHDGFFTTNAEGMHVQDDTTMIISRGLGNSVFPFRVFNHPEIVFVTMHSE